MTGKTRNELFAELGDLDLDAEALLEIVAAARISTQTHTSAPVTAEDDAITVANLPAQQPPSAPNPGTPTTPFATTYAKVGVRPRKQHLSRPLRTRRTAM